MHEEEYAQEMALSQPFDKTKHISQIGDLLILLALQRTKWKADGVAVVKLLKDFRIKMSDVYVRRRHHEKPELYGTKSGQLEVTDPEVRHQVKFLLRVAKALPSWKLNPPPPMSIRDDVGNYFAWKPSSFGMQAATDEEREAEERQRVAVGARRGKREEDLTSPLFD